MHRLQIIEEPYFIDIIRAAEKVIPIRINVNNFIYRYRVISKLKDESIPLDNITISITRTKTYWIRDYGPFFIEKNGDLSIVDFKYLKGTWRLIDDIYPTLYGIKNDIEFDFRANSALSIQGGNFMTDGKGVGMVANSPLENYNTDKTMDEICGVLKQYLGLNEVIVLESQIGDRTGHIDMFSKLVDENTVLVGQWDEADRNYQILENNSQLLIDKGYNVIRIPMLRNPKEEKDTIWTYTNSLIINGTKRNIVLVPQYGASEDSTAILIYENAMPNYKIIGIDSSLIINFFGAIHCTTLTKPLI